MHRDRNRVWSALPLIPHRRCTFFAEVHWDMHQNGGSVLEIYPISAIQYASQTHFRNFGARAARNRRKCVRDAPTRDVSDIKSRISFIAALQDWAPSLRRGMTIESAIVVSTVASHGFARWDEAAAGMHHPDASTYLRSCRAGTFLLQLHPTCILGLATSQSGAIDSKHIPQGKKSLHGMRG